MTRPTKPTPHPDRHDENTAQIWDQMARDARRTAERCDENARRARGGLDTLRTTPRCLREDAR